MQMIEALRKLDDKEQMDIVFLDGRHLVCWYDTLLFEEYFSFVVRVADTGSSPEFEPGKLYEVCESEVKEINGMEITQE